MVQIGRQRGATSMTVPLMLGAFVLLAGFLYWLAITAEPTAPPEMAEEDPIEEEMVESQVVDPAAFETGTEGYTGLTVRLDDVNVAQAIGETAFFIDLPRTPFLVHMGPEVSAQGMPPIGQMATVVGEVMEMNDSTISAWADAQEFTDNDRPLIEFATHYIEAVQIRTSGSAPAGADAAPAEPAAGG